MLILVVRSGRASCISIWPRRRIKKRMTMLHWRSAAKRRGDDVWPVTRMPILNLHVVVGHAACLGHCRLPHSSLLATMDRILRLDAIVSRRKRNDTHSSDGSFRYVVIERGSRVQHSPIVKDDQLTGLHIDGEAVLFLVQNAREGFQSADNGVY